MPKFSEMFTRSEWAIFLRASIRQDAHQRAWAIALDRRNRAILRSIKGSRIAAFLGW